MEPSKKFTLSQGKALTYNALNFMFYAKTLDINFRRRAWKIDYIQRCVICRLVCDPKFDKKYSVVINLAIR